MSDLNREIAEALGLLSDSCNKYEPSSYSSQCWFCDCERAHHRADYEHDLNACMAVIREKWPGIVTVTLNESAAALRGDSLTPIRSSSIEGDTDAIRLAHALREALRE